jgi:hypothetical protein
MADILDLQTKSETENEMETRGMRKESIALRRHHLK